MTEENREIEQIIFGECLEIFLISVYSAFGFLREQEKQPWEWAVDFLRHKHRAAPSIATRPMIDELVRAWKSRDEIIASLEPDSENPEKKT